MKLNHSLFSFALLALTMHTSIAFAQQVVSDRSNAGLNPEAESYLFKQARSSVDWSRRVHQRKKTVYLFQKFRVEGNSRGFIDRTVILNQIDQLNKTLSDPCAIVIRQTGSVSSSGRVNSNLSHQVEIPDCSDRSKPVHPRKKRDLISSISSLLANKSETSVVKALNAYPKSKQTCEALRTQAIQFTMNEDSVLASLKAELKQLSLPDQPASTVSVLQNYPELISSLIPLVEEVRKTRKCPAHKAEQWTQFYSAAWDLYEAKKHQQVMMDKVLESQKQKSFYCGYFQSGNYGEWFSGLLGVQEEKIGFFTNEGKALGPSASRVDPSQEVWVSPLSSRNGGFTADTIYFNLTQGVYLLAVGGNYLNGKGLTHAAYLVFTDEFMEQKQVWSPLDGAKEVIQNKIAARTAELTASVAQCE